MPKFFVRRAAKALIDAEFGTDKESAQLNGCCVSSIEKWRKRMLSDAELEAEYYRLLDVRLADWAEQIPYAIAKILTFLAESGDKLNPGDPDHVKAATEAVKALAEVQMARYMIQLRESA